MEKKGTEKIVVIGIVFLFIFSGFLPAMNSSNTVGKQIISSSEDESTGKMYLMSIISSSFASMVNSCIQTVLFEVVSVVNNIPLLSQLREFFTEQVVNNDVGVKDSGVNEINNDKTFQGLDNGIGNDDPPLPLDYSDPWWNSSWLYRKEITIDRSKVISGPHSSFPVLISFSSDADLASKAQSDGDDIVFVNNATGTKLNHEIELFENITGKLIAWVNVSSLSSTVNTVLYVYYGNPSCSNQENPQGVWDSSSYVMVQHLNETSGICYDSTSHNYDGTPVGALNHNAVGIIDGADGFNGVNSTISVPQPSLTNYTVGMTLSAWVKFNNNTNRQGIIYKWNTGSGQYGYYFEYLQHATYGKCLCFYACSTSAVSPQTGHYGAFTPTVGVWYHVAAVWAPNQYAKTYVNGVLATDKYHTTLISRIFNNNLEPLLVGARTVTGVLVMNGSIDEARVIKIARPVGWLTTEFNNQNDPSSFYSVGPQEVSPQYPSLKNPSPTYGSINVPVSLSELNFTLIDKQNDLMNYSVTMVPDVIGGSQTGINVVNNTAIHVPITGGPLQYNTTYTWQVNLTDGTHWTNTTLSFTTELESGLWWNTGWLYRKEIIINHTKVAADLSNFPVLIHVTDDDIKNNAQPDGDDIVFTDCYGNQLNHEIEYYHSTSGELVAWVNVTSLSSTENTMLYMYYRNPSCSNQENSEDVWDSHYVMVQHLNETSGVHFDSTVYNNDGAPTVTLQGSAVGKAIGGGMRLPLPAISLPRRGYDARTKNEAKIVPL